MRTPNTTFDIYLSGRLPPADPDIAGGTGFLADQWKSANAANEGDRTFFWTATLDVALGTNLPDLYPDAVSQTTVWVPDKNGDGYTVVFVERERRFRGENLLRAYLVKGPTVAINVQEVDGNPALTAITTLLFDQADGFTVSQPAANQARIDLDITEAAQDAVGAMCEANSLQYTDATPELKVRRQMSITADASGIKLDGDAASPGNYYFYATNGSGAKGWRTIDPLALPASNPGASYTGTGIPYPIKVSKSYTDFNVAFPSAQVEIYSLPAKGIIHSAVVKATTQFAGTGVASLTIAIGTVADASRWISGYNGLLAVSDTHFANSVDTINNQVQNFGSATSIKLQLQCNVNLNNLTAGAVDIYLLVSLLP